MHEAVNRSIHHNGFANVPQLQLLRVGLLALSLSLTLTLLYSGWASSH